MKIIGLSVGILCLATAALGDGAPNRLASLSLTDGRTLEAVRIMDSTPSYIIVAHKGGVENVKLSVLPPELRAQFGYDEAKAKAYDAAQEKAGEDSKRQIAEAKQAKEIAAREAAEKKTRRDAAMAKAWNTDLIVHQVTKSGLLVMGTQYIGGGSTGDSLSSVGGGGGVAWSSGQMVADPSKIYFITGYTGEAHEGKTISGSFVDAGTHTFTDTNGASRTVKKLKYIE